MRLPYGIKRGDWIFAQIQVGLIMAAGLILIGMATGWAVKNLLAAAMADAITEAQVTVLPDVILAPSGSPMVQWDKATGRLTITPQFPANAEICLEPGGVCTIPAAFERQVLGR